MNDRYQNHKSSFLGLIVFLVIVIVCGMYLKDHGQLGSLKNQIFKDPTQSKAAVEAGQAQLAQQNKNIARHELAKRNSDFKNDIVDDQVLTKDQFMVTTDMYGFGPAYAVFVFSNNPDYDDVWKAKIKKARKEGLTIATINGNELPENDDTFLYKYYNGDYSLNRNDPKYGKPDGNPHPFMTLFINSEPRQIVINAKSVDVLFKELKAAKEQADKDANNYELPDNHVGIPYPDYGKAIEQGKKYYDEFVKNHNQNDDVNNQDSSVSSKKSY